LNITAGYGSWIFLGVDRVQSRIGKIEQVRTAAEAAVQKQFGPSNPVKIVLGVVGVGIDLSPRRDADEHQHTDGWMFTHDDYNLSVANGRTDIDQYHVVASLPASLKFVRWGRVGRFFSALDFCDRRLFQPISASPGHPYR
jgi:hypothetical protein